MPKVVMNIRYVGMTKINSVSDHEKNRTPDGPSAIDPSRSHLNKVLLGPRTQADALKALWQTGVQKPAKQAETPYVQMVLSASPEYFRDPDHAAGQWSNDRTRDWMKKTAQWLKSEYGNDCVHISMHLDEDTPHIHALIVPTYEKKPRKPGRQKRGESLDDFETRKREAENAAPVRTVGRSSNEKWKKNFARHDARKSYHQAVEPLGIEYGEDFIGEARPSPAHKPTGTWVKEKAAQIVKDQKRIDQDRAELRTVGKRLSDLLDRAEAFLRRPDLPRVARAAGAALMRSAGRATPEPVTGQKAAGGDALRRRIGLTTPKDQETSRSTEKTPKNADTRDDLSI